jgi:hypothetical protein
MRRSAIVIAVFVGMLLGACGGDQPASILEREGPEPSAEQASSTLQAMPTVVVSGIVAALAALVGAWTGAWATHRFVLQREIEALSRERDGLLRLLFQEVFANLTWVWQWKQIPGTMAESPEGVLQWTTWESVRVRLAQLLDDEQLFSSIARFYSSVRYIDSHRFGERSRVFPSGREQAQALVPFVWDVGDEVRKRILDHVPDAAAEVLPPSAELQPTGESTAPRDSEATEGQ